MAQEFLFAALAATANQAETADEQIACLKTDAGSDAEITTVGGEDIVGRLQSGGDRGTAPWRTAIHKQTQIKSSKSKAFIDCYATAGACIDLCEHGNPLVSAGITGEQMREHAQFAALMEHRRGNAITEERHDFLTNPGWCSCCQ